MRISHLPGLVLLVSTCAVAAAEEGLVRVRVEWGGGAARVWSGLLEVDEGRFGAIDGLGVDGEQPGTMWADGRVVWIQRRAGRIYDGFDVEIRAGAAAVLRLTLQSRGDPPVRTKFDVPLAELFDGERAVPIGDGGDRVVLRRTPGDALRLETERPHLVFDPGESFAAEVSLNVHAPQALETNGRFSWTLSPARGTTVLARGSSTVVIRTNLAEPDRVPFAIRLPRQEGAYDLRFVLESPTLRRESRVQVAVASGVPRGADDPRTDAPDPFTIEPPEDRLVDEFETNGSSGRRIERRERLGFLRRSFADLSRVMPFGTAEGAVPAADAATDAAGEPEWAAYTLHVDRVDRLHRLVVTLDAEPPRRVGLSVLQPDAAGHLLPLGLDGGVAIATGDGVVESGTADGRRVVRHAIPFWPHVTRPVLLVHALTATSPLGILRVEVFEAAAPDVSNTARIDRSSGRRLIGPYLHRPLLAEAFGASEALDAATNRSLDDWRTFDLATERFAERLRRSGENAALLAVMGEGSTLFPSGRLRSSLRFDTGRHFSDGGDPQQKDVVELLLRRFDREGLVLIPMLRFSSSLPVLEADLMRAEGPRLELVNVDGRTWRETHSDERNGGPFYDPLDDRVQQAVLAIVREFAARYAAHPSLAAVAIDLGPECCLRYPDLDWGYDDATIERFLRETKTTLPALPGTAADLRRTRVAALTGEFRARWIAWRAAQLAAFHGRISQAITQTHPQLRCVFVVDGPGDAETETLDTATLARWERTSVVERRDPDADPVEPRESLAGRRGVVEFRPPTGRRIAGFDALSPWQPAFTWVAAHVATTGPNDRRPIVRAAASDEVLLFRGGWLPPVGDEASLRNERTRFAELPDSRLIPVPGTPQPLGLRAGRSAGRTWIVVTNDFPHPLTATLELAGRLPSGVERVALELQPFDLRVLSYEEDVRVERTTVRVSAGVEVELRQRLRELDRVIAGLRERRTERRGDLSNPGFELAGATEDALPGWSVPVRDAAAWTIDERHPRTGKASLMLAPRPSGVAAIGSELPLQSERHVVVSAWMRANADDAEARLVFETVVDGETRRRFAPVSVGTKWTRFGFRIDDVPTNVESARVRFEVRGPVRVWIDDVEVRLAHVTAAELRDLETTYAAADLALERKRYADAQRLLDGPWRQFAPPAGDESTATPATNDVPPPITADAPEASRYWPWNWFR
jgi:hypothetical protein